MSSKSISFFLLLVGASLLSATSWESSLFAQEAESAKITTVDGVKLNAVFYPSAKKNSATVILLHPVGEGKNIRIDGWKTLAETLQKSGFAVLMFDFRGHGDSTTVDPEEFWKLQYPANRNYVKRSSKEGDTIDVRDYIKSAGAYMPILVNDIAAVKAYLDRKHDMGLCNTANTIVIGAENGATLGAIWINSEWSRYKATINVLERIQFGKVVQVAQIAQVDKRAEGNDIIGAVWLNISSSLSPTRTVSVGSILGNACKVHGMPCVFFYGDKDTAAKKYNNTVINQLKVKGVKKYDGIVQAEVPTALSGVKLLTKQLKTEETIAKYLLDNIVAEKGNEWESREFATASYVWRYPANPNVPAAAKLKSEKLFKFDTYEKFIPQ